MVHLYNEEYIRLIIECNTNDKDFLVAENDKFYLTHTDSGYILAKKWGLKEDTANVIKNHHEIDYRANNLELISTVYLANILSEYLFITNNHYLRLNKPDNKIWDILNLKPNFILNSYDEIMATYNDSLKILKL